MMFRSSIRWATLSLHITSSTFAGAVYEIPMAKGGDPDFGTSAVAVSADGSTVLVDNFGFATSLWTPTKGHTLVAPGQDPDGSQNFYGTDLNADGSVVVGFTRYPGLYFNAVKWSKSTGIVPLGDLAGGVDGGAAHAIDHAGKFIAAQGISDLGDEAYRWSESKGLQPIGSLHTPVVSHPTGISGDGATVVG